MSEYAFERWNVQRNGVLAKMAEGCNIKEAADPYDAIQKAWKMCRHDTDFLVLTSSCEPETFHLKAAIERVENACRLAAIVVKTDYDSGYRDGLIEQRDRVHRALCSEVEILG